MKIEVYNSGIEAFIIVHCNTEYIVYPCQSCILEMQKTETTIKIYHVNNKKFNPLWYIMNEIFTLEQMRTVLVVDGEYVLRSYEEYSFLKIKNKEYVFDKNMSYETYVFSCNNCSVERKKLYVFDQHKISKRAKWLYLFGGSKTMLPLTGVAILSLTVKFFTLNAVDAWLWYLYACLIVYFLFRLNIYVKSLNSLKNAMLSQSILRYLNSERKEYRKFTDDLTEQYHNVNSGDDYYE